MLLLDLQFWGSHATSEKKIQETVPNAIKADAPKGAHTGQGMWTFSISTVCSRGACILASGLAKSNCGSSLWSRTPGFPRPEGGNSLSILFSQRAIPVLGAGGKQDASPKENVPGKRHGESRCVISNSACMCTPSTHSPSPPLLHIHTVCSPFCLCRI